MEQRKDRPFGSARWAEEFDIRLARLFEPRGLRIGYVNNKPLAFDGDGSTLVIGGAGSGKGRDFLIPMIQAAAKEGKNLWGFDPKGELAAVCLPVFIKYGGEVYLFNPFGLHGLAQHRTNPLSILRLNDPRFEANCRLIAEALVPSSGGSTAEYFELTARDIIDAGLQTLVRVYGRASFDLLYWYISLMVTDQEAWGVMLKAMYTSGSAYLRLIAGRMQQVQCDSPKEFSGLFGTITKSLSFLGNPKVMDALDGDDFDLSDQCREDGTPRSVFFMAPIEYTRQLAGLIRCLFTVSMIAKAARPQARRLLMIVDEAGNMGRFESLLLAVQAYRGSGITAVPVFQDVGQITRAYDASTVQSFIGSCPCRVFMGTRDLETARMISFMLGNETFNYNEPGKQDEARRRAWEALMRFMHGQDPMQSAFDFAHYERASRNESKRERALLAPNEVLALPNDQMIIFIAGENAPPPILADKYPYYTSGVKP